MDLWNSPSFCLYNSFNISREDIFMALEYWITLFVQEFSWTVNSILCSFKQGSRTTQLLINLIQSWIIPVHYTVTFDTVWNHSKFTFDTEWNHSKFTFDGCVWRLAVNTKYIFKNHILCFIKGFNIWFKLSYPYFWPIS